MSAVAKTAITLEDLRAQRDAILELARRYGASNVCVFGSVARGEATPESDIDFLVDFAPEVSLYEIAGLKIELEALLGCKVDVVGASVPKTRFQEQIAEEVVPL